MEQNVTWSVTNERCLARQELPAAMAHKGKGHPRLAVALPAGTEPCSTHTMRGFYVLAAVVALLSAACSKPAPPNCCDDATAPGSASSPPPQQVTASASAAASARSPAPSWATSLIGTYAFAGRNSTGEVTLTRVRPSKDGKWWVFDGVLERKTGNETGYWTELKVVTADGFERKGLLNDTESMASLPAAGRKIELRVTLPNEDLKTIEFVNGVPLKLELQNDKWTVVPSTPR